MASYEETFCLGLRISFSEKVVLRRYRFYSYMLCVAVFQGDCDLQILTLSQSLLVYSRIRGDIHTKNHKPEGIPRYES